MSDVVRLSTPPIEYEFTVTGRIIVAAHCEEDARMEVQSICDDVFIDHTITT